MSNSPANKPLFRAEHVGSFLRPQRLLDAARARKAGKISNAEFIDVQDECIAEIIDFQDEVGMPSVTDGEFRRRVWSSGLTDSLDGMGLKDQGILSFHSESEEYGVPPSPYAKGRLSRRKNIVTDDFKYVKSTKPKGLPKVTIASPAVLHFWLGDASFNPEVFEDRAAFYDDLITVFRDEIADLADAGCQFMQLDDTALPCNCDENARAAIKARGEDADELTVSYVELINDCLSEKPKDMAIGLHMCRGNLKGMWMAEGGYEPIADVIFNNLKIDTFFMEYDTARAGDFKPLRFLPEGKTAVLGLLSTKTPVLESKDELKRRIYEAAQYVPLDQLALSPQCGFSSGGGDGQVNSPDDVRRKLTLILEVADEVWGSV